MRLSISLAWAVLFLNGAIALISGESFICSSANAVDKATTVTASNPNITLRIDGGGWHIEKLAEFVTIHEKDLDDRSRIQAKKYWKNCQQIGDEETKLKNALTRAENKKAIFDEVDKEIHELQEDRKNIEHRREVPADLLREKDFMKSLVSPKNTNEEVLIAYEKIKQAAAEALRKAKANYEVVQNAPGWLRNQ
ncbi:MAG: hypothetical protein K2Q34_05965 [Alphaproteobacteria bacterium]|nr:hypothetical protein [Alphaproteobacteria bacterium]